MKQYNKDLGLSRVIYCFVFPILAFVFLLLESPYTSVLNPYYGHDSAVFMIVGKGWSRGLIPYADLFDHKGPFLYLMNAIGLQINSGKTGVLIVQTVFMTVTLLLIYKIGKLYLKEFWTWIVVLVFMFMYCAMINEGNMAEEWSLPFTLLPIYLSMSYLYRENPVELHPYSYSLIYGICFGLHAMIRMNNAACLCGLILAFVILLLRRKAVKELLLNACILVFGIAIAILPFVIYFYSVDALPDFLYANFIYNFLYASDGFSSKDILDWLIICFRLISVPISAFCGYKLCKNKKINKESYACGLIMMLVSAAMMFLGYGYLHYYLVYVPMMLVGLCWCIKYLSEVKSKGSKRYIAILIAFFIVPFSWSGLRHAGKNLLFDLGGYYDSEVESAKILAYEIPLDERNSVWSYNVPPKFYLYSDILPCYKYFILQSFQSKSNKYINPGIEDLLTTNPPKWIVMNLNGDGNKFINEILDEKYVPVKSVDYGMKLELFKLTE